MRDETDSVGRAAIGAACAIFDSAGRILIVRHTYGRLNWELPGGASAPGEAPDQTAQRELLEETGLRADLDRLTGVYFEPEHDLGPMLHFVFRFRWHDRLTPFAGSAEIDDVGYWPVVALPRPMSDFTETRIRDAAAEAAPRVSKVTARQWETTPTSPRDRDSRA